MAIKHEGIVGIFVEIMLFLLTYVYYFHFRIARRIFFYNIYCLAQRYVFLMIPEESLISCYI